MLINAAVWNFKVTFQIKRLPVYSDFKQIAMTI